VKIRTLLARKGDWPLMVPGPQWVQCQGERPSGHMQAGTNLDLKFHAARFSAALAFQSQRNHMSGPGEQVH